MAIHQLEVDLVIDFLMGLSKKAVVTIDGKKEEYPLSKVVREGNKIDRYVFIEDETGLITSASLVDSLGRNLETNTTQIDKGPDGFNIKFSITLNIEGEMIPNG
ncbi:hypothetical protein [Viridibacillus arvi]|uniref:hypothetical protein n=1 Tax=Viridibacillus arvi TaxID=263475 RepID=UPI0034CED328